MMGASKLNPYQDGQLSMRVIEVLPELQTRAKVDPRVVQKFFMEMKAGSVFPPVIVYLTPDERYLLADGFHRHGSVAKDRRNTTISAVVRPGTLEEALLAGIEANLDVDHFRTPTPEDKIRAAELMIRNETFRMWSDIEIKRRTMMGRNGIQKIRYRLCDDEGILLPDKVMKFAKGGVWTGKWAKYRNSKTTGVRSIFRAGRGRRNLWARIDGKNISLPSDPELARAKLDRLESERKALRVVLSDIYHFNDWLLHRQIVASVIFSGVLISGTFLVPVAEADLASIRMAVGIAVLAAKTGLPCSRLVLVGYFESAYSHASSALSAAALGHYPITTTTPEEVVAEFAPKDAPPEEGS